MTIGPCSEIVSAQTFLLEEEEEEGGGAVHVYYTMTACSEEGHSTPSCKMGT